MRRLVPRASDWVLLGAAVLLVLWPMLVMPLHGYGTSSFASGYREVHIGILGTSGRNCSDDMASSASAMGPIALLMIFYEPIT
jgi:hypothetical protein